jgi:hypothetical protein
LKASTDRRAKLERTFSRSKEIKMFKNRFVLIVALLSLMLVSLAVSGPISRSSDPASLNGFSRPVFVPETDNLSDYAQRHPELRVPAGKVDMTDYFARHPDLRGGFTANVDTAVERVSLDECFDVSLSEVAACRAASQAPIP